MMMMSLAFGGDCQKPRCLTDVESAFLQVEEKESHGDDLYIGFTCFCCSDWRFLHAPRCIMVGGTDKCFLHAFVGIGGGLQIGSLITH